MVEQLHSEPCAVCGEDTAVGSVFFTDRVKIHEGPDVFVCALCEARIRASGKPVQLTAKEVASLTRSASAIGIVWWGGH
jgi:hypothetical protein